MLICLSHYQYHTYDTLHGPGLKFGKGSTFSNIPLNVYLYVSKLNFYNDIDCFTKGTSYYYLKAILLCDGRILLECGKLPDPKKLIENDSFWEDSENDEDDGDDGDEQKRAED